MIYKRDLVRAMRLLIYKNVNIMSLDDTCSVESYNYQNDLYFTDEELSEDEYDFLSYIIGEIKREDAL